ncbi:MAG TPA: glycosyltransferase, partial [Roseiflexaceae bacterium]|nr:glycosyltransferase [Roseiflexaceae bacterium]
MKTNQLGVMQVVSNLDIGGAQEVVRTLAENLAESGCRAVVCTFKDGPLRQEIERIGVPVEILPDRRYSVVQFPQFIGDMLRIRMALADTIRKHRIDVVQT